MHSGSQFKGSRIYVQVAAAALIFATSTALLRAQNPPPDSSTTTVMDGVPGQQDQNAAPPDTPASVTLHGTVVNKVTHQPVPRALVQVAEKAVLTDGDGHFEIVAVSMPMVMFAVKKPGFLDPNSQPQLSEPWQRGMVVAPDQPDLTLAITPEAVIAGRIAMPDAEPGEGFYVALYRRTLQDGRPTWVQAGGTTSNSRGAFRFADLAPGTYYLATQAKLDTDAANIIVTGGSGHGFPPVYSGTGTEFSSSSEFTLAAGQHFDAELDAARESFHQVTITVTNSPPGTAIQPSLMDKSTQQSGYPIMYDQQKRLIRAVVPNGSYTLRASAIVNGQPEQLGQLSFVVDEKPQTALSLTLSPMATIPVVVRQDFVETPVEANGQAVASSELQTPPPVGFDAQSQPPTSEETSPPDQRVIRQPPVSMYLSAVDLSGTQGNLQPVRGANDDSWSMTGIIPGRYWVQAQGIRGYIASMTAAGVDLMRDPLVVGPGGTTPPIEVTLRNDGATLKVTLAASDNPSPATFATAFVYIIPDFDFVGPISQLAVTNNPGAGLSASIGFSTSGPVPNSDSTVSGLVPGSYHVYTFATPHDLEYRNPEAMQAYSAQSQAVTLTAHDTVSLEVKLPPPAE
jgi:hypothetical protein